MEHLTKNSWNRSHDQILKLRIGATVKYNKGTVSKIADLVGTTAILENGDSIKFYTEAFTVIK